MTRATDADIALAWDVCEDTFGDDKSLEFMIAWSADHAGCDQDDVIDWLARRAEAKG